MLELYLKRAHALLLFLLSFEGQCQDPWNRFLQNETVTFDECSRFYADMASRYPRSAKLIDYGQSDGGKPISLFLISGNGVLTPEAVKDAKHTLLLINNGIHAGEPDGVNACIKLTHDILDGRLSIPRNLVIAIIPWYNPDGAVNTSCCFRAGQNGPSTVGFRANARNLDLNRDFIKCDSENAKVFSRIYSQWDPDVFIDTHVSNGADYQHVMTLIDSQRSKLHPEISKTMQYTLLPFLYKEMESKGQPMSPYVNVFSGSPDKGMQGFMESPRYASGYSALFNAFPFVTETHMLKPFPQRVEATCLFLQIMFEACGRFGATLRDARSKARQAVSAQTEFPLTWQIDTTRTDSVLFRGFEAYYAKSEVTGQQQLYYDRSKPYTRYIPYLNTYTPGKTAIAPVAYLLPRAWREVAERLSSNGIQMRRLSRDTVIRAEVYYIRDYKSAKTPYEGHYLHHGVAVEKDTQQILCFRGDYVIDAQQPGRRYLIETLEPEATDAFFAWNFFDAILQQKEWYSDYEFDREALKILNENPELKKEFENLRQNDSTFAASNWDMLTWVFRHSPWYEPSHNRYPVLRLFSIPEKTLEAVKE